MKIQTKLPGPTGREVDDDVREIEMQQYTTHSRRRGGSGGGTVVFGGRAPTRSRRRSDRHSDLRGDLGTAHDASHRSHGAVHGSLEVLELLLHQQAGDLSERAVDRAGARKQAHVRRERPPSIPPPMSTTHSPPRLYAIITPSRLETGEPIEKTRSNSPGCYLIE